MRSQAKSRTVRRSVALPRQVVDELAEVVPVEQRSNLNRLVVIALRELVERRRQMAFAEAMAAMAADRAIKKECAAIAKELAKAEEDGLRSTK